MFSDPLPRTSADGAVVMPGHVGTIYQASNAIYTGRATRRTLILLPDGTVFSARSAQKIRRQECGHEYAERTLIAWGARPPSAGEKPAAWLAAALDDAHARKLRHPGNHRYLFRLGNSRERTRTAIALRPARMAAMQGQGQNIPFLSADPRRQRTGERRNFAADQDRSNNRRSQQPASGPSGRPDGRHPGQAQPANQRIQRPDTSSTASHERRRGAGREDHPVAGPADIAARGGPIPNIQTSWVGIIPDVWTRRSRRVRRGIPMAPRPWSGGHRDLPRQRVRDQ
jgi:hypothetical protein